MPAPSVPDAAWLWANEPCRAACPVHTDAGAYVTAIADGRYEEAYLIARRPNPFPSVCGRVCAAPCERACRRGSLDAPVAIRALKRFVTERFGVESFAANSMWHQGHGDVPPAVGPSVGIIGGGPAGLAAACELRLAGHPVTVYEAQATLGGMMVLGIPEYRLPRELIRREVGAIIELGIDVEYNARIGVTHSFELLLERHACIFIAVGTSRSRDLDLPGHDLDGVLRATEFLLNINQGFNVDLGARVVVVGGGNVAFDAARTALRSSVDSSSLATAASTDRASDDDNRRSMTTTLDVARAARRAGVLDVTIVALESAEEIPADPEEIAEAESEGIKLVYRRGPHRFVGERAVTGIETIAVESVFDAQGRFAPLFIAGSESVLLADSVILAVGQSADIDFVDLGASPPMRRTQGGGIEINPDTMRTSMPRVWAGGDVARGPRNLIDAIADGKRAAASIHAALIGAPMAPTLRAAEIAVTIRTGFRRINSDYDAIPRQLIPATPTARRIGFAEVEHGFDEDAARLEGLRCLRCFDNIMLTPELCILCGLCVDVCPTDCITIARADHVDAGTAAQSVLLLDEDLCIRCGLCVNRCPPAALTMTHATEIAHA